MMLKTQITKPILSSLITERSTIIEGYIMSSHTKTKSSTRKSCLAVPLLFDKTELSQGLESFIY